MKRYSTYRDSGISWIGEIPEHWKTKRLGSVFTENREINSKMEYLEAYKFNYGTLIRKDVDVDPLELVETYSKYNIIKTNDIVINGLNLNYDFVSQRVAGTYSDGIITSAYLVFRPRKNVNHQFYLYFFKAMDNLKLFHGMGSGIRLTLSYSDLKNQRIVSPSPHEQQAIVSFLNKKISKIDNFIAKQERQIELLKELKQAEVARVVTKGLNPEVKMKDSGIGWIGEIPEHWKMRKIKYVFTERSEKGYPEEPVLCSTQKYGVIPQSMYKNRVVVVNKGLEGLKLVKEGDFVISLRSFQGGIEYAYYRGIISAAYTILKLNNTLNEGYIKYLVKSFYFVELLKTCVTGIREGQNINYSSLRKHSIPIPPPSEQQEIVEYIERKTTEVDKLIVELTYQVEYLKEYKQRLISDVVTGKINVQPE